MPLGLRKIPLIFSFRSLSPLQIDILTRFHRTLQRVWLANRGCLLLWTPGPVPFGTCIWSHVETILSWTCHVYGPFEFRTSLDISILLTTVCIIPILLSLICWTHFMTLMTFVSFAVLKSVSIAMKVPVLPIPALKCQFPLFWMWNVYNLQVEICVYVWLHIFCS